MRQFLFRDPAGMGPSHVPGQIPQHLLHELDRVAPMPTAKKPKLAKVGPVLSIDRVVEGLGFSPADQRAWHNFMDHVLHQASETAMRQDLIREFQTRNLDPALRQVLFARAMEYRKTLEKSMIFELVSFEQLAKAREIAATLTKGEARGGSYYRRVANPDGKGYRYYYSAGEYHARNDAHLDGKETKKSRAKKAIQAMVEKKAELSLDAIKALAAKYGDEACTEALGELEKNNLLKYENEKVTATKATKGKADQ